MCRAQHVQDRECSSILPWVLIDVISCSRVQQNLAFSLRRVMSTARTYRSWSAKFNQRW